MNHKLNKIEKDLIISIPVYNVDDQVNKKQIERLKQYTNSQRSSDFTFLRIIKKKHSDSKNKRIQVQVEHSQKQNAAMNHNLISQNYNVSKNFKQYISRSEYSQYKKNTPIKINEISHQTVIQQNFVSPLHQKRFDLKLQKNSPLNSQQNTQMFKNDQAMRDIQLENLKMIDNQKNSPLNSNSQNNEQFYNLSKKYKDTQNFSSSYQNKEDKLNSFVNSTGLNNYQNDELNVKDQKFFDHQRQIADGISKIQLAVIHQRNSLELKSNDIYESQNLSTQVNQKQDQENYQHYLAPLKKQKQPINPELSFQEYQQQLTDEVINSVTTIFQRYIDQQKSNQMDLVHFQKYLLKTHINHLQSQQLQYPQQQSSSQYQQQQQQIIFDNITKQFQEQSDKIIQNQLYQQQNDQNVKSQQNDNQQYLQKEQKQQNLQQINRQQQQQSMSNNNQQQYQMQNPQNQITDSIKQQFQNYNNQQNQKKNLCNQNQNYISQDPTNVKAQSYRIQQENDEPYTSELLNCSNNQNQRLFSFSQQQNQNESFEQIEQIIKQQNVLSDGIQQFQSFKKQSQNNFDHYQNQLSQKQQPQNIFSQDKFTQIDHMAQLESTHSQNEHQNKNSQTLDLELEEIDNSYELIQHKQIFIKNLKEQVKNFISSQDKITQTNDNPSPLNSIQAFIIQDNDKFLNEQSKILNTAQDQKIQINNYQSQQQFLEDDQKSQMNNYDITLDQNVLKNDDKLQQQIQKVDEQMTNIILDKLSQINEENINLVQNTNHNQLLQDTQQSINELECKKFNQSFDENIFSNEEQPQLAQNSNQKFQKQIMIDNDQIPYKNFGQSQNKIVQTNQIETYQEQNSNQKQSAQKQIINEIYQSPVKNLNKSFEKVNLTSNEKDYQNSQSQIQQSNQCDISQDKTTQTINNQIIQTKQFQYEFYSSNDKVTQTSNYNENENIQNKSFDQRDMLSKYKQSNDKMIQTNEQLQQQTQQFQYEFYSSNNKVTQTSNDYENIQSKTCVQHDQQNQQFKLKQSNDKLIQANQQLKQINNDWQKLSIPQYNYDNLEQSKYIENPFSQEIFNKIQSKFDSIDKNFTQQSIKQSKDQHKDEIIVPSNQQIFQEPNLIYKQLMEQPTSIYQRDPQQTFHLKQDKYMPNQLSQKITNKLNDLIDQPQNLKSYVAKNSIITDKFNSPEKLQNMVSKSIDDIISNTFKRFNNGVQQIQENNFQNESPDVYRSMKQKAMLDLSQLDDLIKQEKQPVNMFKIPSKLEIIRSQQLEEAKKSPKQQIQKKQKSNSHSKPTNYAESMMERERQRKLKISSYTSKYQNKWDIITKFDF